MIPQRQGLLRPFMTDRSILRVSLLLPVAGIHPRPASEKNVAIGVWDVVYVAVPGGGAE